LALALGLGELSLAQEPAAVSPAPTPAEPDTFHLPGAPFVPMAPESTTPGAGEGTEPPVNPYAGDLFTRPYLTGDWLGARSALADRGLTFDLHSTQFYQGVASGGREQEFQYGGKLDYLFNLDGGKLGLWQGFFVDLHAETRYGEDVNGIDGLLAPANLVMAFPEPNTSITSITGLKLTQALSENFAVYLGKINTLDEYPVRFNPHFVGLPGRGGFLNTSLVFNPIAARTIPYAAAGVGAAVLREGEPLFTFTVFDPEERAAKGLEDLFTRGVVLVPDLALRGKPLGRPGVYNFGGTYSNARYRSFDPAAYLDILGQLGRGDPVLDVLSPEETGSWSVYSNFYQSLWVDPCDEERNWGLFGQFGLSDGNPNPVRYVANGGVAGRSMIPGRALDTFGVGYFYLGLSDNFKALARPIRPQRDEYGVELFYNLAVTPWCRLSSDLQIARPSTVEFDTAIITGLRLQVLF
ncbi:MAG TPA: carbohydrate porin, partial [Gemmataceae bacterium]